MRAELSAGKSKDFDPASGAADRLTSAKPSFWNPFLEVKETSRILSAKLFEDKPVRLFGYALVSIDLLFILLHAVMAVLIYLNLYTMPGLFASSPLALHNDGGYAEYFNYMQLLLIVGVFMMLWFRTRQPVHLAWALAFLFAAGDDALRLHERFGHWFSAAIEQPESSWLTAANIGEPLFWAACGIPLLIVIVWAYRRSQPPHRALAAITGLCFMLIAAFAFAVDIVHQLAMAGEAPRAIKAILTVVEDGGEMLAVSFTCVVAVLMLRHFGHPVQDRA